VSPSEVISLETADPDEAMAVGGGAFYPHSLSELEDPRRFTMRLDAVQQGPITAGVLRYGVPLQVTARDLGSYHINIPLAGGLASEFAGCAVAATPTCAAVYGPIGPVELQGWGPGHAVALVKVDRVALEAHLACLLERQVDGPIRFAGSLDLGRGPGARLVPAGATAL
jgi:hypothetical protein